QSLIPISAPMPPSSPSDSERPPPSASSSESDRDWMRLDSGDASPFRATTGAPRGQLPTFTGYEVLGELGRDSLGMAYKARHLGLNRVVTLKVISDAHFPRGEQLARLKADGPDRLRHPNIVQVIDIGEDGLAAFLAQEYVEGTSLGHWL